MSISIYSLLTAFLCCNVFILISLIFSRPRLLSNNGVTVLTFLMAAIFLRLLFFVEIPFTIVIHSYKLLPAVVSFLRLELFSVFDFPVTTGRLLLITWFCGSAVLLLRLIYDLIKHNMKTQHLTTAPNLKAEKIMADIVSRTKPGQVYRLIESKSVAVPMVSGFFRPTIFIPDLSLSDEDLKNVLMHEWNHFLQRDIWKKLCVYVIWALLWWNPLIYLLIQEFNQLLEVSCDINQTSNLNDEERVAYLSSTLNVLKKLELSKVHTPINTIGFGGSNKGKRIKQRFQTVLGYRNKKNGPKNFIIVSLMLIFLVMSYGFVIQPVITPPEEDIVESLVITPENAFIVSDEDGTYTLYINGISQGYIAKDDLDDYPLSSLPIFIN